jgi:hypothetical protein
VVVVVGLLAGIKALQIRAMINQGKQLKMPPGIVIVDDEQDFARGLARQVLSPLALHSASCRGLS